MAAVTRDISGGGGTCERIHGYHNTAVHQNAWNLSKTSRTWRVCRSHSVRCGGAQEHQQAWRR